MAFNGDIPESAKDDRQQLVERDEHSGDQRMEVSPLQLETHNHHRSSKGGQEGLKVVIISSICFAISVTVALLLTIYFGPPQVAPHGGVASDSKVCSELGVKLLLKGGSAVDAAVATSLCVGLVNPHCSGIGGGGIMLVRSHKLNSTDVVEFMDAAPTVLTDKTQPFAAAVPGLLRGLQYAHRKFGKLSWKEVVMSVVNMFTNERLNALLKNVAQNGADEFYLGQTAKDIIALNKEGSALSTSDFSRYKVNHNKPISTTFFDKTVETTGSLTNGPVLLTLLNVMEHVLINNTALWNSTDLYHYIVEAMKLAYDASDRLYTENDEDNITAVITSKEFAAQLASRINPNNTLADSTYSTEFVSYNHSGSSHVSVIGPGDVMVSVTLTLGSRSSWNSVSAIPILGFAMNNHLAVVPKKYQITPGQHLPDSVAPAIVYATRTPCAQRISVGASHGDFSAAGVAEFIMNIIGLKMDIVRAVNASRVYSEVTPGDMYCDDGLQPEVLEMFKSKGHFDCQKLAAGSNTINVVSKTNEIVAGYADMRTTDGYASVY